MSLGLHGLYGFYVEVSIRVHRGSWGETANSFPLPSPSYAPERIAEVRID